MSYILDALKRAESERSRGEVPNIHAPSVLIGSTEGEGHGPDPLTWVVAASLLMVLAAAVWWWSADTPVASVEVAMERPLQQPSAPPQAAAPAAVAPKPPEPVASVIPPPLVFKPLPTKEATKLPARSAVAQPASPPSTEERVYAVKELPPEIRTALPTVTVGGASYSENPGSRMLIINGQIYHEGDKLTPELTLQQIRLRTAVLSFRGYLYAISY
jgi:general secretion pathway protein B